MKKEYVTPEVEIVKFMEAEEVMSTLSGDPFNPEWDVEEWSTP